MFAIGRVNSRNVEADIDMLFVNKSVVEKSRYYFSYIIRFLFNTDYRC